VTVVMSWSDREAFSSPLAPAMAEKIVDLPD